MGMLDIFRRKKAEEKPARKKPAYRKKAGNRKQTGSYRKQIGSKSEETVSREKALAVFDPIIKLLHEQHETTKRQLGYYKEYLDRSLEDNKKLRTTVKELNKNVSDLEKELEVLRVTKREQLSEVRSRVESSQSQSKPETAQVNEGGLEPAARIIGVLTRTKSRMTVKELADWIHKSPSRTNDFLLKLLESGKITRSKTGKKLYYEVKK